MLEAGWPALMTEIQPILHAVLAPAGDAGEARPTAPAAAQWQDLLRQTPGQCHPWIAACAARRYPNDVLPDSVRAAFDAAMKSAAIGYLQRKPLLRRFLPALDAAEIPFIVLKGAALAHVVYPEPSLRTMGDLDIWTRPEDLERAAQVALDAGLRYDTHLADLTPASAELRRTPTRLFEWPGSSQHVEIHGALKSMAGFSPAWFTEAWRRSELRALGDLRARVLHPEDMLTHLVVHCGRQHHFEYGLRALVDIGLVIERESARLSWTGLLRGWRREGIETWALLALALSRDFTGARLPAGVDARIAGIRGFGNLTATAAAQVLTPGTVLPPGAARLVTSTARERVAWLRYRVTTWYWKGPEGSRRTPREVLRDGTRRMRHDLMHKLPRYARGLLDGTLRGTEFRRRREIARNTGRLDALVAATEAAGPGRRDAADAL